jgi:hypothetical protein
MLWLVCIVGAGAVSGLYAQENRGSTVQEPDSLPPIRFTPEQASDYIHRLMATELFRFQVADKSLSELLNRLLDHYEEPFDSVKAKLGNMPEDAYGLSSMQRLHSDTIPVRWLNQHSFILDTVPLSREPLLLKQTVTMKLADLSGLLPENVSEELRNLLDSVFQTRDTINEMVIDTAFLRSRKVELYHIEGELIEPPMTFPDSYTGHSFLPGKEGLVVFSTHEYVHADKNGSHIGVRPVDSLLNAVETLLQYLTQRDSALLMIRGADGVRTPLWITTGRPDLSRFWIKNDQNDSISIWVGNPEHRLITLQLEEGVNVKRPEKLGAQDLPVIHVQPVRKLVPIRPLEGAPHAWKNSFVGSVSLNQNHLSNWAKGGVSSFSTMVDLLAKSDYVNKQTKEQWNSSGRLRYGSIRSKENGYRTNNDILEFNSQYNRQQREKLDFSALLYFKTQIAYGYKYPNDSVVVSKFLNPGAFTVGVGFEYRPVKNGSINVSPLSYKNTFVLDTANINQTAHGVDATQRSRQEFGGQVLVRHSMSVFNGMAVSNSLRLFSSYLNKPQNIDVDWELGMEKQINWYFTIRVNLHLIYDDDVKFAILDADGNPVKWPDGTPRKAPRTQINQFLGLTLTFRI